MPDDARRDAHTFFHIGNVGSTLISRLLGSFRASSLARAICCSAPSPTTRAGERWPRCCRAPSGPSSAPSKATSFTSEIANASSQPGSRVLFLCDPATLSVEHPQPARKLQTAAILSPIRLARLQGRCPGLGARPRSRAIRSIKAALGWAWMTSLGVRFAASPDAVLWMDFDRSDRSRRPFQHYSPSISSTRGARGGRAICEAR